MQKEMNVPRRVTVLTKFGRDTVLVRPIGPAKRLYVLVQPFVIPKGRQLAAGGFTETETVIAEGAILFPHREAKTGRLRHDIYAEGLFDAIRGRMLTMLGYGVQSDGGGERGNVRVLRHTVYEFWSLLATYATLSARERTELQAGMKSILGQLWLVRDPLKLEAREKIRASASVKDILGRSNPAAARARLQAAWGRLGMRLEEIQRITPAIGYYEIVLLNERDRIYAIFGELWRVLTVLMGKRGILRSDSKAVERSRQGIAARLEGLVVELETIHLEPFVFSREKLIEELRAAIRIIRLRANVSSAILLLDRSRRSILFRAFQREFENCRNEFSYAFASHRWPAPIFSSIRRLMELGARTLNDTGFVAPQRDPLIRELAAAYELIDESDRDELKAHLARAARLLSRPVPVG